MTNESEYPDPGEVPVLDWLDCEVISVDPLYQRPLDTARVETILRNFTWRSFGALVVVPHADGTYRVTDGQHRLEAAKLHPKVKFVPACIVKVEDIEAEARVFVDINKHRKNVTSLELFFAQMAAGDEGALAIHRVASRADIRIPKYANGKTKPRDTIAVGAVQGLIAKHGEDRAAAIMKLLADAEFEPITAAHIKAVEHLLTDAEYADQIAEPDLAATVKAIGNTGDPEAKRFAATHCCPFWKGLASVWFGKCKKRRAPRTSVVAPFAPRQSITASVLGDPAPGRSALDQKRAS